ncbi:MAG: hypothetical protein ICV75_07775 [Nitrospiraceae bacterium]|nr:hypothetical protein [Nitrospiraceae bacterium]
MAQKSRRDFIERVQRLTDAAELYVNRSPKVKRLEAERSALLDAIADVQLALSVQRLPPVPAAERPAPSSDSKQTSRLKAALKQAEVRMTESQRSLSRLSDDLQTLQANADRAKAWLDTLQEHEPQDKAA